MLNIPLFPPRPLNHRTGCHHHPKPSRNFPENGLFFTSESYARRRSIKVGYMLLNRVAVRVCIASERFG